MKHASILLLLLSLCSCAPLSVNEPKRELRAFWVATVVNIDWPKQGSDPIEKKKADFLETLDFYQDLNFNTAIVQVRTAGDAFYPSDKAPWSRYLTGKEGEPPVNNTDLLPWMISETHKRGMEFHAWLNPYRATFNADTLSLSENHDFYKHREWMIRYGNKYYYDPALPEVQEHLISLVDELVKNYPIDAVHFDDYFYPYKIQGETFNDSLSYQKYNPEQLDRDSWRRANVDSLVRGVHQVIKAQKPWVQFGISPFGVWRNKSQDPRGSDTRAGQTNYDDLYADPMSWIKNGWVDYIAPQVYWTMKHPLASHKKIVDWWNSLDLKTNLYIGNGAYRALTDKDPDWQNEKQLVKQVRLARRSDNVSGNIYFSAKSLMSTGEPAAELLKKEYSHQALTPVLPKAVPGDFSNIRVTAVQTADRLTQIHFDSDRSETLKQMVVYDLNKIPGKSPDRVNDFLSIIPLQVHGTHLQAELPEELIANKKKIIFTLVDRFGNESQFFETEI